MPPLVGAAAGGLSCPLRKETPSACSSRTVVARVKGRRPPSTFSSVERLSLACSASDCREMRRRAISSRMVSATCWLCSAESCLSGCIVTPANGAQYSRRTSPHKAAQNRQRRRRPTPDNAGTMPIIPLAPPPAIPHKSRRRRCPSGSDENDHLRRNHLRRDRDSQARQSGGPVAQGAES